ncbi:MULTISPECIES: hypothetical protein [unclassified Micromonospora]|uniref:hypothetical protein n=1 Tax=unclassified Micromonospora TaxID=2617518 RepID=UPI0033167183
MVRTNGTGRVVVRADGRESGIGRAEVEVEVAQQARGMGGHHPQPVLRGLAGPARRCLRRRRGGR